MILIGSRAIKHWFPDFPREPKDEDWAVNCSASYPKTKNVEYLENPILMNYQYLGDVLTPNDLLTLKMSHLFWNINWRKHMFDVQFLLKKGCKLNIDLFNQLYEYWNVYHSKNQRSDLKMSAQDFFTNALVCDYNHDDLHILLNPIPTYTKVLIGEVDVCEKKFEQLSFEEKCDLVREEVMVMAWERYTKLDYREAYFLMLQKFVISHAPMWEALFIIHNFIYLHKPTFNYFQTIEDNLFKLQPKTC